MNKFIKTVSVTFSIFLSVSPSLSLLLSFPLHIRSFTMKHGTFLLLLCFTSFLSPPVASSLVFDVIDQTDRLENSLYYEPLVGRHHSDPDEGLTIPQLIESRGFKSQQHTVQTHDGYLLNHYRIVNPQIANPIKRPVVMFHGLLVSSSEFIINPGGHINETLLPGEYGNNLGFELAKQGYDVWLCNVRGNEYSSSHAWLKPTSREFWNFSKDEFIKHDLPDTLEYIQLMTNSSKLAYVGHSQGTHIMFGLLATQAKYNDIIEPFIALAPVATVKHVTTFLRVLANSRFLLRLIQEYNRFLKPQWIERHVANFCKSYRSKWCNEVVFLINGGVDSGQVNATRISTYLSILGYGTSTKNIVAWGQNVVSGTFSFFDYGYANNKQMYGTFTPPSYDLAKITNKHIALFTSMADNLADAKDVDILRASLKVTPVLDYLVPLPQFSHLDFAIGMDTGFFVNKKIFELLEAYKEAMVQG